MHRPAPPRRTARHHTAARADRLWPAVTAVTLLTLLALAGVGAGWSLHHSPRSDQLLLIAGSYLGMSLLCFLFYAHDKQAARTGQWRTPESTLHWLALFGGWPGAWLAQSLLRHKSSKASFRRVFRITVVLNLIAALALTTPEGRAFVLSLLRSL